MATVGIEDLGKLLDGMPRPRYLAGEGTYERIGDLYRLRAHAIFPSSDPSIGDRASGRIPHVNIAHCMFGVWNAVHAIARLEGRDGDAFLSGPGTYTPGRIVPPDAQVDLEVTLELKDERRGTMRGTYEGIYRQDARELQRIAGSGIIGPAGILARYVQGRR
jgi:hypothetical protein